MAFSSIDEFRTGELDMSGDVETYKDKLKACEKYIAAIDLNCSDQFSLEEKTKTLFDYIALASNFVNIFISFLEKVQSRLQLKPLNKLDPLLVILKMTTNVIKIYFHKDIASIVILHFHEIMSENISTRCRATCHRVSYCASYVNEMPDTDDIGKKRFHLQLLASEFPIHDALTDVLEVGYRIQDMVRKEGFTKFKELAYLFQLYCILSTFTEMYLLYRIAVMSKYGEDASSINAVLQKQRDYDKDVLNIAHRPTKVTIELYLNCELDKWPILKSFLMRRNLLSEFVGEMLISDIRPLNKETKCITFQKKIFRRQYSIALTDSTEEKEFSFSFVPRVDSEKEEVTTCYTIVASSTKTGVHGNVCVDSDKLILSKNSADKWHVLQIYPESNAEPPAFMIWLADNHQKCLCLSRCNNIFLTSCTKPVERFMWTFHIEKKVKYAYQESPHSEKTASPHSQEEERERAWLIK